MTPDLLIQWCRVNAEHEHKHSLTVSGSGEAAEIYTNIADTIARLTAEVERLKRHLQKIVDVWDGKSSGFCHEMPCAIFNARPALTDTAPDGREER